MTWSEVAVVVVTALLLLAWWVWVAANRLDRLHRKVVASRTALDGQLVRRASAAAEIATAGLLDPVSSVLVGEAAWSALAAGTSDEALTAQLGVRLDLPAASGWPGRSEAGTDDAGGAGDAVARELVESELSRTLRTALGDPEESAELTATPLGAELLGTLAATWYRVQLARRFHNEAVAQTQRVRRKPLVRLLRLQGHAAVPHTVEIDDAWPDGLQRPGHGD